MMNAERWKRRTLPTLKTGPTVSTHYEPLADAPEMVESKTIDTKTPRVISRALRSLSSSSLDSLNSNSARSTASNRRLHKTQNNSGSMIERIHRRVSKDVSSMAPATEGPDTPLGQSFTTMELVSYGHLKTDVSILKARSEYLVLTDQCLIKFGSVEAARGIFPQLSQPETRPRRGSTHSMNSKTTEVRFEIPLESIVAVFNEEGASPRFGIEVWWFSQWPRLAYSKAHLFFSLPKERDDWLANIQKTCRVKHRRSSIHSVIPENLRTRINHIIGNSESLLADFQNLIFPVAKRVMTTPSKPNSAEESHLQVDGSSFYFVIGPCMCYLVEVLKADYGTAPGELRVKSQSFGTVTLTRFKASVASQEQRFFMSFRSPFGRDTRLDLASTSYRRIIEALTRMDRILKPMWPQHFQQIIFDIKGLPAPLQLTSGNDLGGVEQSLQAYCTAFHVDIPLWTVEWNTPYQPAFRLISIEGCTYSPLQLIAVFRALRYNTYFRAISFRDVDLSSLAGKKDPSPYGEGVVYTSLNGSTIPEEHCDHLLQAPVLTQELHAVVFASESIRSIDLTNTVGVRNHRNKQNRGPTDYASYRKSSSEMLSPLLMLSRRQLGMCQSFAMSGNPVAQSDIDDLANILVLDHVCFKKLELAECSLGDKGLSKLWTALNGQANCLEVIDTSDNQGTVGFETIRYALSQLRAIQRLNIAGNTRIATDVSLFDEAALNRWELQELDLSGIALNDTTVEVLADYLQTAKSQKLETMRLNKCGLTGRQIARLFRAMGQGRKMTLHINANRLDEGIEDLCGAIACGHGPWSLFMQMVEFSYEASYVKLWKAFTVNKTIECLSLAGSATPDAVTAAACQTVSEFFSNNTTIRFLDISGYDAKLDEGRLGKEFSKALSGMQYNTKIEHLRVRSQMLNYNIGDLAEAISGNKTLHTLDCEDNDFNISNLRHLVKNLTGNLTIRYFSAFSVQELARSVQKSVGPAGAITPPRRNSMISRFRHDKTQKGSSDGVLAQHLKNEWDAAVAELDLILERNQRFYQEARQSEAADGLSSSEHEAEGTFSNSFGGLASREYESRHRKNSHSARTPSQKPSGGTGSSMPDLQVFQGATVVRSISVSSSEAALSPTSPASFCSSPREVGSPTERLFPEGTHGDEGEPRHAFEGVHGDDDGELQMMIRRHFDAVGRIEEEDDGN